MSLIAEKKIAKARANLIMSHPFFGTLALRLKVAADPTLKTASCDGITVRYNPKWVEKMPQSKVEGLFAHEVMHPAFLHHTRRGERDIAKWNAACDYAINDILVKAGFDLPEAGCINPMYSGMTAEHIYNLLPDGPGGGGSGEGGGGGGGEEGESGSQPNPDPGGDGGVQDSPNSQNQGGSQSQQNHEEAEWKVALAQAAHVAKQAGKLPADIERMIDDLLEPQLPWRELLRRFMTEKAQDDFTWRRANRRFIAQGLYLPTRESEGSGEFVVVIDTSGSIGEKELNEFGSEIAGIVRDVRPTAVHVIYCDAAVNKVVTFGPDDEIVLEAVGGGGTDFRPPFKHVIDNNLNPKCIVYLTDGYGPFPEEGDVPFPTMWVINNEDVTPPWGEHLTMST